MHNKTALLYPDQMHLRLECLCFLSWFLFFYFVLFLFSEWSIPSHLKKQNILSVLPPLLLILTRGDGGGHGDREPESIFNHKDNSLSLTHSAAPERIWHLRDWVARVILIYLAIGTEGIGSGKWTVGVRMSQGFWGENRVQVKKKWFIHSGGRTTARLVEMRH